MAHYRIRKDVSPYGGRVLEATHETDEFVQGWVRLSYRKVATAERTYKRGELTLAEQVQA